MQDFIPVISIVLGFLSCFFGYRLLRVAVPLISFFVGFSLAYLILGQWAVMDGARLLFTSIGIGSSIAVISAVFVKACVFFAGGIAGVFVFRFISHFFPAVFGETGSGRMFLIGLLFFVILGLLALRVKRTVLAAFTAYVGAYLIVTAFAAFAGRPEATLGELAENAPTFIIALSAFTLAGFIAQKRFSGKKARGAV